MSHVEPMSPHDLVALAPLLDATEASLGFLPNSMLTMAHRPQLLLAFMMLANVVRGADLQTVMEQVRPLAASVDGQSGADLAAELVQLIAYATSVSAGCRYCQAHTAHGGHHAGLDRRKLDEVLQFESSDAYSEAERAAVALALAAGAVPNAVTGEHFERLREHFDESEIVQIVAVLSLFGFLNRWNDTMATGLEPAPAGFAAESLAAVGWQLGKHA